MPNTIRQWVQKAEADWLLVEEIKQRSPDLNDQICFHCQQVAEKYLKVMLQQLGLAVPKTHNLDGLLQHLLPHDATLRPLRRRLVTLARFAVDYRYPGFNATTRQAQASIRSATVIREELRRRLGLPT